MRKIPLITLLIATLFVASCSKGPELTNSIPDNAFLVASFHPKQLHDKGQIGTFESITQKIDNEVLLGIIKDPTLSGVDLNAFAYAFVYFPEENDDDPSIGFTAALKDEGKFASMIKDLMKDEELKITTSGDYSMIIPENDDAAMAWNQEQVIFLTSPDHNNSAEASQEKLMDLFELAKEDAVTSIVDFKDFSGKMKDMNVWITGDELKKMMNKAPSMKGMDFDFPVELNNNYAQIFMEFDDGAMYLHSETHLSDDVSKATETFMVAKEELNKDLLEITPGNNLLLAMAFSVDLEKMSKMMKNFSPPQMDSVSGKIEQVTGIAGKDILEALNGDFVMAVNGAPEGSAIPIEILIGIGLDDETLQDKLLGTAGNWADVQQDGEFFTINVNGMELYSGIVNGIWVLTNASGYKEAVTGKGLEKTLNDTKFMDYAGGSMGMYYNLDITTYPAAIQAIMASGGAPEMLETFTESFVSLGMQASNKNSDMTLITAKKDENSLYTLLKVMEMAQKAK